MKGKLFFGLKIPLTFVLWIAGYFPISARGAVSDFDKFDANNLTIYTKQGYYLNNTLRGRIPLQTLRPYLDFTKAPTCSNLIKNNAAYLSQIYVIPGNPIRATDFKLYYLLNEALRKRGESTNQVVYRGNRTCNYLLDRTDKPIPYFVEMGFMSTSLSEEKAQIFTKHSNDQDALNSEEKVGCLMVIETKGGKRIAKATGNYNNEDEVLVPPESLFQITKMVRDGKQIVFHMKELARDSSEANEIIENLDFLRFVEAAQAIYPHLVPSSQMAPPANPIDPKSLTPEGLKSYGELAKEAESACQEAYRFFSPNPVLRDKLKREKPVYDLTNRNLDPDDYIYSE